MPTWLISLVDEANLVRMTGFVVVVNVVKGKGQRVEADMVKLTSLVDEANV